LDFRFRLITAEDNRFLVQMLYEATIASEQTFDLDNIENSPHAYAYIENFPEAGELGIIAESTDGIAAGAAWLRIFPEEDKPGVYAPELTIAIVPSYRRQHLAKHIMEHLYKAANALNIRILKLGVYQKNLPALEFYKKDGWEPDVIFGDYVMMKRYI